jgi:gluconokinase
VSPLPTDDRPRDQHDQTDETTATITVVVMGVSGSGKTSVAKRLVDILGWPFAEGDEFHPPANVEKMRSGTPLTDEDRWPWLAAVAEWIGEQAGAGHSAIVTCSALKRSYRDALRDGHPSVWFLHVHPSQQVLQRRVDARTDHYMPASLLTSQLETLQPLADDEPGITIGGEGSPDEVAAAALDALRHERGHRLPDDTTLDTTHDSTPDTTPGSP